MKTTTDPLGNDAELLDACRQGDRDAFGVLVARYQGLICSLAYSRTGSVAVSEEVAQETFLAAWLQIRSLREPEKLRAWLCGIVRNLASQAGRRLGRARAVPLEEVGEARSGAADPEALAVSRQEEELVWEVLGRIPETYREPLVLFYRENESIESVAAMLGLSADAVKQRLSRGRAMLREEIAGRVESALVRSRPGEGFTAAVLGVVSAGKVAGGAALAGPVIGMGLAWTAARLAGMTATSEQEKRAIAVGFRRAILFTVAMVAVLLVAVFGTVSWGWSPWWLGLGSFVWTGVLLWRLMGLGAGVRAEVSAVRAARGRRVESRARFLGLPLFCYASGGLDVGAAQQIARGWVAVGDMAVSPLLAIGGVAVGPVALGGLTVGVVSVGALAMGGLAVGALAAGWVSAGPLAAGWRAACGGMALARDFALGGMARAAEANSAAAREWFAAQWWPGPAWFLLRQGWWVVGLCIVIPLVLMARRAWRMK
jgi:RNA polymerase sigma factor (sigma-70 family)